jgi:hypothetical protein
MATIDSKESLILLVEKKPLLYDKQLKDYKRNDLKEDV